MDDSGRAVTVLVIGAGQAGLSAAHHLQRRGFVGPGQQIPADAPGSYVVLDANPAAGGAWQHRWESLTMATVNGIFDLPGLPRTAADPGEPSRLAVPRYFADYERAFELAILRPVRVRSVRPQDDDPHGRLRIETDRGSWTARYVINASGTWDNPVQAGIAGAADFRGRQWHTRDYRTASDFAGQRVAIVGGGISAVQLLEEISRVATTFWYTRREPQWRTGEFMPETTGRAVIAQVTADAEAGRPGRSIVSYTGLGDTAYVRAARERGALVRRPMFVAIEPDGVREADGSATPLDSILWATGFRPAIDHLAPMALTGPLGGIPLAGTRAARDERIHLIGFGPSQSTVGANRAGRAAVAEIVAGLRASGVGHS